MKKNLLIGNGINQCTDRNIFSTQEINKRFIRSIVRNADECNYSELKKYLLKSITLIENSGDKNIEQLASIVFKNIEKSTENEGCMFTGNQEQRLKRILKKIAIESIFLDKDQFISINIETSIVKAIKEYLNIFTLNYYEYWDDSTICEYLHKSIRKTENGKGIVGYESCVFSPLLNFDKSKSDALYPSDRLFPSEDLFPVGEYVLYDSLKKLNEIHIFGMSPYGDKELINIIRNINTKRIYIYNMNENPDELGEWKKHVGNAEYIDSKFFISTYK
jgi:hypothetical protein